jgi:hypothetical protein
MRIYAPVAMKLTWDSPVSLSCARKRGKMMGKLLRNQIYVFLHSRFCLIFFIVTLLLSVLLFFDNGDVVEGSE